MDKILTSFTKLSRNIREIFSSDDRWSDILADLERELQQVRIDFISRCVDALQNSKYDKAIINRSIKSSIDIIIISFQFIYVMKHISRYISKEDIPDFAEKLLRTLCRKHDEKCVDIINCYHGLKKGKAEKLTYFFSIDISKFICGYETHDIPSNFPCLNSYISNGIPKEILARTNVTGSSFIIQTQIPALKNETILVFETCFEAIYKNNEDFVDNKEDIQLDFLKRDE